MGWLDTAKKIQSGEIKINTRRIDEKISLPEVEIKADKVTAESGSGLKKYALGAAIVLALGYFVYKW